MTAQAFDHQLLGRHAFGVVDAASQEDLPASIRSEALVPADLAANAHLMPRLIDFRGAPDEHWIPLLECLFDAHQNELPPPLALLVKTEASAQEFAGRWNALQLATPGPGRKAWLRLHDPRVLHQLLRILTPAQRRHLFGQSQAFTYWIGGEWTTAHADVPAGATAYAPPATWDWPRIERIGVVNRALQRAGVQGADSLTRQGAVAEQLIERAQARHRLTEADDVVEFAARGLTAGQAFDQHPVVAAAVPPDADGDSTLADRFALIEEDLWSALRQPLPA
jgi:hypothetical protein